MPLRRLQCSARHATRPCVCASLQPAKRQAGRPTGPTAALPPNVPCQQHRVRLLGAAAAMVTTQALTMITRHQQQRARKGAGATRQQVRCGGAAGASGAQHGTG